MGRNVYSYFIYMVLLIMISAVLTVICLGAWSALINIRIYHRRRKIKRLGKDDDAHVPLSAPDQLRPLDGQNALVVDGLGGEEYRSNEIMQTASLYQLSGMGIVVSCPTGILVGNQVGGYLCAHLRLEGFYIPLVRSDSPIMASLLMHFFHGKKWQGDCYNGIDVETADFMDDVFRQEFHSKGLKVDRNKLDSCMEAWIHVTFDETAFAPGNAAILAPPIQGSGVVTWPNSD